MTLVVKTATCELADELEALLLAADEPHLRRKALQCFFVLHSDDHDQLTSDYGHYFEEIYDAADRLNGQDTIPQTLNLNADNGFVYPDSYPLARVCRRRAPWNVDSPEISVTTTFESTRTGQGVDIYCIELHPFQFSHTDFSGRASHPDSTPGIDLRGPTAAGARQHATAVLSCAGGDLYGIAKNATLWGVDDEIEGQGWGAIEWTFVCDKVLQHYQSRAALNRPAVLNVSSGGFAALPSALPALIDAGIVVCVSAGNNATDTDLPGFSHWPKNEDPDIISTGSTNQNDTPAFFSNFGTDVDIWSPGRWVKLAIPTNLTQYWSGTSFSSPYTAGVVACMLEGYQRLTSRAQVQAVKAKLIENSTKDAIRLFPNQQGSNDGGATQSIPYRIDNNRLLYLDPYVVREPIAGLVAA